MFEPLTGARVRPAGGDPPRACGPRRRRAAALETVELDAADGRRLPTYSKGMRQRVKLAQAIVHEPRVIVLDEPLTGLDPRQRAHMIELFHRLGDEGRCVVVASHVLDEVERFGSDVLVMAKGRLAAAGDFREIRALMDDRPRRIRVRTSAPAELAGDLLHAGVVVGAQIDGDDGLSLDTDDARGLARAIARSRARAASPCSRCAPSTRTSRTCSATWWSDEQRPPRRPSRRLLGLELRGVVPARRSGYR